MIELRKPTLSPSRIATYLACPVKYRWTYVDPRGRWFVRAKSYYSFGASLHAVMVRFHEQGDVGVQTKEQVTASLEENWVSAGYCSPEEAAEALAEGRELLLAYVEASEALPSTARTIYVEKQLRMDMGEFVLVGRLDRVDEHEDGTLEIVDYKSGRSTTDPEDLLSDIAMSSYQLLLRSILPGKRVLSTIIAMKTQERTTVEPSRECLEQFQSDLVLVGREILNRDYENVLPTVKDICPACDFLPLCRRHPEFAEDYQARFSV